MSKEHSSYRVGRRVWFVAIFLGLGLITTIAVAWGIAAWMPQDRGSLSPVLWASAYSPMSMDLVRATGAETCVWNYFPAELNALPPNYMRTKPDYYAYTKVEGQREQSVGNAPSWSRPRMVEGAALTNGDSKCDRGTGWPFLAGWYEVSMSFRWKPRSTGILLNGPGQWSSPVHGWDSDRIRALPLTPIWTGLISDTLFYASIWAAILLVAGAIRRSIRRRRGLCPWCAYDRTGLRQGALCPECGRADRSASQQPKHTPNMAASGKIDVRRC